MVLNAPNGTDLRAYYTGHPGYVGNCLNNTKTNRLGFTPYNIQETIYWFIKMLALPIVATLLFFLVFQAGLGSFDNPIIQNISYVLVFIGNIFMTSYIRELARARWYRIRENQGLIDERDANTLIDNAEPPFTVHLNQLARVDYNIGFVGDIMMMRNHDLIFHQDIIDFFNGVNIIVGNLEGIVRIPGHTTCTQAHVPDILTQLQRLLTPNTEWLLCLSNNHSIDFGNREFHDSLNLVHPTPNSYVFGRNDVPNILSQHHAINIATATQWSNQGNWHCISQYEDGNVSDGFAALHLGNHFNIHFPHWSYENERYVRHSIQAHARTLLCGEDQIIPPGASANRWDLIFGHHPHVRQPIMTVDDISRNGTQFRKLVVFSGGNFTSGVVFIRARKHLYGTIMRCQIGPLAADPAQLAIGDVRWQRTYNERLRTNNDNNNSNENNNNHYEWTKQVIIDTRRYRRSNITSLCIALFMILSIILVRFLDIFLF
jgi:hypothetical protein